MGYIFHPLCAIYVHQWKSRRVDDIAVNHDLSTAEPRIICSSGGANFNDPVRLRTIEAPGLIDCDMHIHKPPRESFIMCLIGMTPPIPARTVRGTRRRGTVYGSPYQI